ISDVAKEWSRFNGVIMYKHKDGGAAPQQVHSNLSNLGITDLLAIQMNMMEDISGVNGALQGKLESNSMSGTLYSQQTQNSLTALADMLRTYNDFIAECSAKDISNMRQFYSPQMVSSILGESLPLADRENFFDSSLDFSIRIGKAAGGMETGEEGINAR
ncbi:MAG: hypothetical protein K2H76_02920, partial [Muribaculaceae bacterium]|nr:hypothetical protein [Muribaculaceae bacterium]